MLQYTNRLGIRIFIFTIITMGIISISHSTQCMGLDIDDKKLPFDYGEKLTFQVRWGPIPAGEAVLEVLPPETLHGTTVNHFVMTARTNSFVDIFYKVRNRIDAYTDYELTNSILYKNRKKGRNKRDIIVNFDWAKMVATYSDFGKNKKTAPLLSGAFDPLSVFYYFRVAELCVNKEIQRPVTDGKRCILGKAHVIKEEKIKVQEKTYDTYLVEPELSDLKGVFEKSKNASLQVWVTKEKRTPVRIKSEVIVGSFVAELIPE